MKNDLEKTINEILEQSKANNQPVRYDDIIMMILNRQQGEASLAELSARFGQDEIDRIHEALGDLFIDGMVDICSIGSETTCELTPKGVSWADKQDQERSNQIDNTKAATGEHSDSD